MPSPTLPEPTVEPDPYAPFHRDLAAFNRDRLAPQSEGDWIQQIAHESHWRLIEARFVETECARVHGWAHEAPTDADGFVAWYGRLRLKGPGQHDPLFEFLAERASLEQMTWFLRQELAGEAGFDDLLALTQIKMPIRAKLEMARNLWDEMGQGHASGMHGPMLERLATELGIRGGEPVWESLALGNLMIALACNRRHAYRSIGALGVIELTASGRAEKVNAGLKRLGVVGEARRYYALHATLDLKHSEAWNREVLGSLVADNPSIAHAIAEGALMRLMAGKRCFERYRLEFGLEIAQRTSQPPVYASAS